MQSADVGFNKRSLVLTLKRYSSAVGDMERTVLVPSLLRDVPSDCEAADDARRDLYADYSMLRAIRNTAESSLAPPLPPDDLKAKTSALATTPEPLLDADPEALFLFHLRGLFSVMNDLTKTTKSLTERYLDIIGVASR
ncbi:thyroid hormone-inducible hepatic protein [Austrofundulus limnaeus]|uniref:Thyroid hormone-inducible hepatic protein n=1 Tax=Austrofundulus limnaeus TaxID=52670 RepID=A0A2I4BKI1_AUSLI|nr:PREDICTED: mid1-interacting protein 1A-like [Austrofundulus limnaeus]